MSNGGCTHIPKVVEDEMIFVAYDTHFVPYISSFFFSLLLGLQWGGQGC